MRTSFLSLVLVVSVVASPAGAAIIDFASGPDSPTPLPYGEDGFTLSVLSGTAAIALVDGGPGFDRLEIYNSTGSTASVTLRLTRDGGGPFDATSIGFTNSFFISGASLTITSSAGSQSLPSSGSGTQLLPGFTNIDYLDLVAANFSFDLTDLARLDNLVVTPVPEPSAVAAVGLLAAGMLARRRRRA